MHNRSSVFAVILLVVWSVACSDADADKQRFLESGNQFFEQKKYQEAVVQYRNALRIDEMHGEARYKLAESYAALGDTRNAFQQYVRAADLLRDDAGVQMKAATMLLLAGQFDDAETRVRAVLERDPKHADAHVLLGNILARQKDIDGAIAQIEEAIDVDPTRGTSYSNLGAMRLAQGDREAARTAFEKAVAIDPKSIEARLALAMFQLQMSDVAGAEQSLNAALGIDARHALANRMLASLYLASGRAPQAEPYIKAYVEATPSDRAAFTLADYYVAVNRLNEARAALQPLTAKETTASDAEVRLARLDYATDRAAAHQRLDALIARRADHLDARLTKARWLLVENKPAEALPHAQAAVKVMPTSAAAHYAVGMAHAGMQDIDAAMASYNEVLRLNPRAASAQLQLSRLQLARGAVSETVQLAESALKNAPGSPEARLTLAAGLVAQREFARSEPMIAALQKDYPNVAVVEALAGRQHLAKQNLALARVSYERAVKLDPKSQPAIAGLTAIDLLEKKNEDARHRVDAYLAHSPNDVQMMLLASRVYLAANDAAAAEKSLRRVIELAPAESRAYAMLGSLYAAQQRLPEARDQFDRLADRNPKSVSARTLAAMLSHTRNELDDAKKRYQAILDLDANAAVAANNLAWIIAEEGKDLDAALRLAERAALAAPNRPEIHDTVGWIYYKKELPTVAVASFEKSIKQDPNNATYRYHLALAYAKSGNVDDARTAATVALKLDPNHREARELLGTLR